MHLFDLYPLLNYLSNRARVIFNLYRIRRTDILVVKLEVRTMEVSEPPHMEIINAHHEPLDQELPKGYHDVSWDSGRDVGVVIHLEGEEEFTCFHP